MAFSPAWGGLIPTVKIGSLRGFLKHREKSLALMYHASLVRTVLFKALATTPGKAVVKRLAPFYAGLPGVRPEVMARQDIVAWTAWLKFQHSMAPRVRRATITEVFEQPGKGSKAQPFPQGYFRAIDRPRPTARDLQTQANPPEDGGAENRTFYTFSAWLERRYYRKGRLSNVQIHKGRR